MSDIKQFETRNIRMIKKMGKDKSLNNLSKKFINDSSKYEYSYHFNWLGLPIIQFPQDMMAMQEIIWKIKPDAIIETGIARGGSLIFYASMLKLLENNGIVIGVDIDIRSHNKKSLERHPFYNKIKLIEGSSIDIKTIEDIKKLIKNKKKILVVLDSNHSHEHVLQELNLYSPLVKKGSYVIVFDSIVEDMPPSFITNRPWSKGNNPKTAVWEFLKTNKRFKIDKDTENKLLISVAPDGYLKCIK
jgi:cephalosporin hydroxylase